MEIRRQDDVTTIDELIGFPLDQLLMVGTCIDDGCYCFMRCREQWHRFFIDEGVLFWDTTDPDTNDFLGKDHFVSIPEELGLVNHPMTINKILMRDDKLTIELTNSHSLIFIQDNVTYNIKVCLAESS
ncbi:hypothetical protein MNBD_PLANCTO02-2508 [hydrothermal vent metagenome]|uniref:Uncharacterized protein n=1 Tax=hydrothermal vent metagenome TaxID=652676 RepID=A0A3B1E0N8_9ZZZZ